MIPQISAAACLLSAAVAPSPKQIFYKFVVRDAKRIIASPAVRTLEGMSAKIEIMLGSADVSIELTPTLKSDGISSRVKFHVEKPSGRSNISSGQFQPQIWDGLARIQAPDRQLSVLVLGPGGSARVVQKLAKPLKSGAYVKLRGDEVELDVTGAVVNDGP